MLNEAKHLDSFGHTRLTNDLRFFASLKMTSTSKMKKLTHIGSDGRAQMVDVSAKPLSKRTAVASGKIQLQQQTLDLIAKDQIAKGNVFASAQIAGIQA